MTDEEYQAFYARADKRRPTVEEQSLWDFRCWTRWEAEDNWWRVKFEAGKIVISLTMGALIIWALS